MESELEMVLPQQEVPSKDGDRQRLRETVRRYVGDKQLLPPLSLDELRFHAKEILSGESQGTRWLDFTTILVGNETWRDWVSTVPYERRILLLPQCLRKRSECPAEMDEVGLLCENCGRCPLGGLIQEAEELGYVVLVSEGTHMVVSLLRQGGLDAVVGASCISALKKTFPHMSDDAVPGMAVPLLRDGCDQTEVDLEWLRETIRLRSSGSSWFGLEIPSLREEVRRWFDPEALSALIPPGKTLTAKAASEWLLGGGRRWRPLLAACVYAALTNRAGPPEEVRRVGVALECFHKASLIHDDIEDGEATRYGKKTLHREYGVPFALNVGDLLLGEGYRMIAESGLGRNQVADLLKICATAHAEMCLGQGQELEGRMGRSPMTLDDVLQVYRRKTSAAFEVSLLAGAVCAQASPEILFVLKTLSASLGVAYQIRDDLQDDYPAEGRGIGGKQRMGVFMSNSG